MKTRIFIRILGSIMRLMGVILLVPGLVAALYGETSGVISFGLTSLLTMLTGIILERIGTAGTIGNKEGFAVVSIGWLCVAFFGGLPYYFLGTSIIDALFESMSAFTTTGATILTDSNAQGYWIINGALAKESIASAIELAASPYIQGIARHTGSETYFGLLFWRSFAQWIGGMGIILLFIAILPHLGVAGRQLYKAEVPGPTKDVLTPRVRDTAKILWTVYLMITAIEIILLVAFKMPLYDAVCNTFSTLATGGFSPQANSIAAYKSPIIEWIVLIFMFLSGANFALHYRVIRGDKTALIRDAEFQSYSVIAIFATAVLVLFGGFEGVLQDKIRLAAFQVVSIMTTTGFITANFDAWSTTAKFSLFVLMFVGACAGSTSGAIKVSRIQLMLKYGYLELFRALHPKAVVQVKYNGAAVKEEVVHSILSFINQYVLIFAVAVLVLAANCYVAGVQMDMVELTSASATSLGNIGPGLGKLFIDFHILPDFSKMVLFFCMWIGRLEIIPALVLLVPDFWKK
ncbi:MAG: TrkH family potassium uptake protein [Methanotrichaceae archaeon]